MPDTTTVLTIDLPGDLGDRLRRVMRQRPEKSLRAITLEALEEWLERHGSPPVPDLEPEFATQVFKGPLKGEPPPT